MGLPKELDFLSPFMQKDLPEMTDADWERLERSRKERWERENKEVQRLRREREQAEFNEDHPVRKRKWGSKMLYLSDLDTAFPRSDSHVFDVRFSNGETKRITSNLRKREIETDFMGKEVCLCYYGKDRNADVAKVVSVRFVDESKNMRRMNSCTSEILKIAKSLIAVSCLDGMPAPKAKRTVNAIIARHTNGFFRDQSWENVQKIWNDFRQEGIDWSLIDAKYSNNSDGVPSGKTWRFQIDWLNEKGLTRSMFGVVVASGAGTVEDPLDRYDLVGYVS